jgi:hypothetical protein
VSAAALIEKVLRSLPDARIWEAAAGDGLGLVDPVRMAGYEVIATDIERRRRDIAQLDYVLGRDARGRSIRPPSCFLGGKMKKDGNPPTALIAPSRAETGVP